MVKRLLVIVVSVMLVCVIPSSAFGLALNANSVIDTTIDAMANAGALKSSLKEDAKTKLKNSWNPKGAGESVEIDVPALQEPMEILTSEAKIKGLLPDGIGVEELNQMTNKELKKLIKNPDNLTDLKDVCERVIRAEADELGLEMTDEQVNEAVNEATNKTL